MGEGGFAAAWLLGTAIGVYRQVTRSHRMPVPGNILALQAFFAVLALIGDVVPNARRVVTLLAWGLDIAGVLQLLSSGPLSGQVATAQASQATAEGRTTTSAPGNTSPFPSTATGSGGDTSSLQQSNP